MEEKRLERTLAYIQEGIDFGLLNPEDIKIRTNFSDDVSQKKFDMKISEPSQFKEIIIQNVSNYPLLKFSENFTLKLLNPDGSTKKIDSQNANNFMDEFKNEFDSIYHRPLRVHNTIIKNLYKEAFQGKLKKRVIHVYLGQNGNNIILFVEKNGSYFQISDTIVAMDITSNINDYKTQFEKGIGDKIDNYIMNKTNSGIVKNTRKFNVGSVIEDELLNITNIPNTSCVLFYPAIYTLDDEITQFDEYGNEIKVKHEHKLTFVMTIADYNNLNFQLVTTNAFFDRNGLCPPGNC